MKTFTDNANSEISLSGDVDFKQIAIEEVLQKADEWIGRCCKGPTPSWCENYGCDAIRELVEPLRKFQSEGQSNS